MNPLDIIIRFFDLINKLTSHKPRHYVHSRDRRSSPAYLKKRKVVKNVWTVTLVLSLILLQFNHPMILAVIIALAVFTTFIAFVILDESK